MARSRNQRILNLATGMVLASALSAASSACANLLTNGSFETGPSPGAGTLLSGGSTALTGWVVTRGNVDYVGGSWEAQDGACTVALNGDAAGGVAQSFATYPGALYGVSFYLSGDPFTTPALKHVRLAAADSSADFSFDITPAWPWHMDWTLHEWTFTARTASTTLELYSLESGSSGPAIDNVSVTLLSSLGAADGRTTEFALAPVAPNPARGRARIGYSVPRTAPVRVSLLDLAGREVAVLADGVHSPGRYTVDWDAGWARGAVGTGLYFVRLQVPGRALSQRLAVIR